MSSPLIAEVRAASRELVRELGFLNQTLPGTDLSPSAAHAIVEVGAAGQLSATALSEILLLEKSTVSRLVKTLIDKGLMRAARSQSDSRLKPLHLTERGEQTLAALTQTAERRVSAAIECLDAEARNVVARGLRDYAGALKASRTTARDSEIAEGYAPGLIGRVVAMHAAFYSAHAGFGAAFETKVASDLAEFATRLEDPRNALWRAERNGEIVGSIAIDGEDLGDGLAHLRWFIVDPRFQGSGLGRRLLRAALDHCDGQGVAETHLWTFEGLDAARRLYEVHGFVLTDQYLGHQWGSDVLEQIFVRRHPNP